MTKKTFSCIKKAEYGEKKESSAFLYIALSILFILALFEVFS